MLFLRVCVRQYLEPKTTATTAHASHLKLRMRTTEQVDFTFVSNDQQARIDDTERERGRTQRNVHNILRRFSSIRLHLLHLHPLHALSGRRCDDDGVTKWIYVLYGGQGRARVPNNWPK